MGYPVNPGVWHPGDIAAPFVKTPLLRQVTREAYWLVPLHERFGGGSGLFSTLQVVLPICVLLEQLILFGIQQINTLL